MRPSPGRALGDCRTIRRLLETHVRVSRVVQRLRVVWLDHRVAVPFGEHAAQFVLESFAKLGHEFAAERNAKRS